MRQLVILAGGMGTRLAGQLGNTPKPMAPVAGRPVLEYHLEIAERHGFSDVHLLTCHRAEALEAHFGDGRRFGVAIRYHVESEPMGTAGAVLQALPRLADRFVVLYADTLLDVDLDRFWRSHVDSQADASLLVHPNGHPHDSDLVEIDAEGWIRVFHAHPHPARPYLRNLVNAALYVVEKQALERWAPPGGKLDFAHDLFPRMLFAGARLHGYRSREYIKDLGTPDRLARVEADFKSGLVERLSLRNPCPAVFLDRDGTLNVEIDRVRSAEQLEIIDGAAEAVRRLNREGLLAVVVSNQPVVARGDCTAEELTEIHNKMETVLGAEGGYLDRIYHCPHHPDRGFAGERAELKISCACRKPGVALIERAVADLNIRIERSWMIGDTTTDLQTARNAGVKAVLVRTGYAGRDRRFPARPDFEFMNVREAVDFILDVHAPLLARARALLPPCKPGSLVAVGGLSRSGKSTWAELFREVLAERGQRGVIIPIDSWLRSAADRRPGHVTGRFDLEAIGDAVRRLAGRTTPVALDLGHYDRVTREQDGNGGSVTIEPEDIVFFEGVPALAIEALVAVSSCRVYVECPEEMRRQRFSAEYRLRGVPDDDIERLYRERDVDEHPFVRASAAAANVRIGE